MKRSKLWSGLTSTSAALLVVGLIGQNLAAANGTASNSVIEHVTPYWQTAITAEIAVTGILTAVFFVLLVLSKTKKKAKKQ